jgi:hypothetical protein
VLPIITTIATIIILVLHHPPLFPAVLVSEYFAQIVSVIMKEGLIWDGLPLFPYVITVLIIFYAAVETVEKVVEKVEKKKYVQRMYAVAEMYKKVAIIHTTMLIIVHTTVFVTRVVLRIV